MSLILFAGAVSCQDQGSRYEVTTGQQGQTAVRRVPYTPEEQAAQQRAGNTSAPATTSPADADLTTLQTLWPKLSQSDRAAIIDLAKRSVDLGK
jgi:hypothetical protein